MRFFPLQTITYTPFKKAKNIKQGDELFQTNFNELIISYGIDNERRKTIETKTENGNITATRTKFFANNYELIQTTQNSSFQEKEILYIFAPDGLTVINETMINHCKIEIGNCKF